MKDNLRVEEQEGTRLTYVEASPKRWIKINYGFIFWGEGII